MRLSRATALVPALAGALLLAGCAAGAAAEKTPTPKPTSEPVAEQSVAEACGLLGEKLQFLKDLGGFEEGLAKAASDPEGMTAVFETADAEFAAATLEVSNLEVRPAADAMSEGLHEYAVLLRGMMTDPANADLEAMGSVVDGFMTPLSGLGEICSA